MYGRCYRVRTLQSAGLGSAAARESHESRPNGTVCKNNTRYYHETIRNDNDFQTNVRVRPWRPMRLCETQRARTPAKNRTRTETCERNGERLDANGYTSPTTDRSLILYIYFFILRRPYRVVNVISSSYYHHCYLLITITLWPPATARPPRPKTRYLPASIRRYNNIIIIVIAVDAVPQWQWYAGPSRAKIRSKKTRHDDRRTTKTIEFIWW